MNFDEVLYLNEITYIIPHENWETLSQKSKQELFDENKVIVKINHTSNWKTSFEKAMRVHEGKMLSMWNFGC